MEHLLLYWKPQCKDYSKYRITGFTSWFLRFNNPNKDKRSASNNWVLRYFFQPSTKNSKILFTVSFDWLINNNVMLTETTSTTDWFSSSFSCGNSQNKKVHKSKKIIIHDFTIHKKGSKYYTEAGCFTQVWAGLLIHKISFFLIRCFIYWA
mgnify:CR=1 FL=1